MSNYRWNFVVLIIVAAVIGITATANYAINFYGLFGDVRGKKYFVYMNSRTTKYLFAYNYIPQNFDGLLIGSSSSANWNTGELTGIRMYNASLNGGNITEEALITDKVLEKSRPRLVLFAIHPYLTMNTGRKSGYMYPQEYWGGLGSLQLFFGYGAEQLVQRGYARRVFNEYGREDFIVLQPNPNQAPPGIQQSFVIDTQRFEEYRKLLERVRESGARIAGVIPPVRMSEWENMKTAFDDYCKKITPLFRENEPIIDLNDAVFDEFKKNPENYQDEIHLSTIGAKRVIQIIDSKLHEANLLAAEATRP